MSLSASAIRELAGLIGLELPAGRPVELARELELVQSLADRYRAGLCPDDGPYLRPADHRSTV